MLLGAEREPLDAHEPVAQGVHDGARVEGLQRGERRDVVLRRIDVARGAVGVEERLGVVPGVVLGGGGGCEADNRDEDGGEAADGH